MLVIRRPNAAFDFPKGLQEQARGVDYGAKKSMLKMKYNVTIYGIQNELRV